MGLSVNAAILIRFLKDNDFSFVRSKGTSHQVYSNGVNSVSIPVHKGKNIPLGTLMGILDDTGLSKKKFEKWLGR